MTTITENRPTTLGELTRSTGPLGWKSILTLLRKTSKCITIAEGGVHMGNYHKVVLTGNGFELESGKVGMSATCGGGSSPKRTSLRKVSKVRERIIAFSKTLEGDSPTTPAPSESEIVNNLLSEIEEILGAKQARDEENARWELVLDELNKKHTSGKITAEQLWLIVHVLSDEEREEVLEDAERLMSANRRVALSDRADFFDQA